MLMLRISTGAYRDIGFVASFQVIERGHLMVLGWDAMPGSFQSGKGLNIHVG